MSVARSGPANDTSEDPTPPESANERPKKPSKPPSMPPEPVNIRAISASNTKQARLKEAEADRALITRVQGGDTGAFRALVERHQRRAFAIALSLVRDENDARELVQDAFLRVYKGIHTFQGTSSFFTWLYRIITNLSIDLIRKPGHKSSAIAVAEDRVEEDNEDTVFPFLSRVDGSDPADVVRRREIGARLQEALEALPSYHRGVIVMREVEGLSYEEMAQVMGVSKGTIMSRLFHARQKLQRALIDCYEEQVGPGARAGIAVSATATEARAATERVDDVSPDSSESGGAQ